MRTAIAYPGTRFRPQWRVRRDIECLLEALRGRGQTLHLGCGDTRLAGTINCDLYSETADRRLDATDLSELADGSIAAIEHHHMIEHLSSSELRRAMAEWARVLQPGGFLIVSAPDFERVVKRWIAMTEDERWGYGIKMVYGSQEHAGMFHKNGFTPARLANELALVGLRQEWFYRGYPVRPTPSFISIARRPA